MPARRPKQPLNVAKKLDSLDETGSNWATSIVGPSPSWPQPARFESVFVGRRHMINPDSTDALIAAGGK